MRARERRKSWVRRELLTIFSKRFEETNEKGKNDYEMSSPDVSIVVNLFHPSNTVQK